MPPALKTSKREIIEIALQIARESGFNSITAREIGKRLNLSSRPIYTFYPSMKDLKQDALNEMLRIFKSYLQRDYPHSHNDFLSMGLGQVQFARDEPQLYRIINREYFSNEYDLQRIDRNLISEVKRIDILQGLSESAIEDAFLKLGIFTQGLTESVLSGAIEDNSDERIYRLLYEVGEAILINAGANLSQ